MSMCALCVCCVLCVCMCVRYVCVHCVGGCAVRVHACIHACVRVCDINTCILCVHPTELPLLCYFSGESFTNNSLQKFVEISVLVPINIDA